MKLFWHSLLLILGILLPTSTVLGEELTATRQINDKQSSQPALASTTTPVDEGETLTSCSFDDINAALFLNGTVTVDSPTCTVQKQQNNRLFAPESSKTEVSPKIVVEAESTLPKTDASIENPPEAIETDSTSTESESQESPAKQTETVETEFSGADCPPIIEEAETLTNPEIATEVETPELETPQPETPTETDTATSKTKEKPEPTPEEIARYQKLAQADQLYLCGSSNLAERLYREAKEPFAAEVALEREIIPQSIHEPEQLSPGGKVYWRLYQQGLENKKLKTKVLIPLKLLVEQYPEFIPGHVRYAEALTEYGQEEEALEVLEQGVALYPNEPDLVLAKVKAEEASENWLEASITARQFALFNPDHFRSREFMQIAQTDLGHYQDELRSDLTSNTIGSIITGGLSFALTGYWGGPLSALQTTILLLQGESAVGEKFSESIQEELPLVKDEEVVGYVQEIGNKLASAAGRDEFDYEFYVVMDDRLNAFALPGGKVFINAGAIVETDSEAELAGLIAHELSHAVLSHSFQLMTEGTLTVNVVELVPYVGSFASNLIVLNYSREMEQQADTFGTRLLGASGYAADGVRNLMVTLEKQDNPNPPAWLSTHPDTNDRVRYLEELIVRQNFNRYTYEGVVRHQKISKKVEKLLDDYKKSEKE